MGKALPVFYDCHNCPSYCCSYPRIIVTPRDIRRLAKHFGLDEATARRRFTKKGEEPGEIVLRHQKDETYGTVCRFLDLETRMCTVHKVRPRICRDHPGSPVCHYYNFLMSERAYQDDPTFIARAYNPPDD
jgi:Fe-S-cluster containining protein